MPDINKFIENERVSAADPEGRLLELDPWSEEAARRLAAAEDIQLTVEHWDVVLFLRSHYAEHGPAPNARTLLEALEKKVEGGKKRFYQLFPKGPVTQGSRIAGVPVPAHATDPGFGGLLSRARPHVPRHAGPLPPPCGPRSDAVRCRPCSYSHPWSR